MGRIPIETRTEIYRDPDNGQQITVNTDGRTVTLGIADVTVSRESGDEAPIVIKPESECIEVRNEGNTNGVHIRTEGDQKELEKGFSARIRRDAVLKVGYQTEFRLTVEREAREEYIIDGDVDADGDVVMGDQRNVDERTTVEDVVAKELEVDGETSGDVQDTVANEMHVGGDRSGDTQNICEEHGIYTGPVCPDCAEKDTTQNDRPSTKYCLYCGEPVPESARSCPECGKGFPDME
ncbi:zinc ribbon domain-containing protein [Halorhabdus amylolytica]|uniref:zinc ribbon domain-containing protein n=1 Tax=Halorhabdus amylolytica TaxID=2559573 RepID=UPI0010AB408B|nr:zinc ribbon domain-containing protein [Halorhabdus amylolytica]